MYVCQAKSRDWTPRGLCLLMVIDWTGGVRGRGVEQSRVQEYSVKRTGELPIEGLWTERGDDRDTNEVGRCRGSEVFSFIGFSWTGISKEREREMKEERKKERKEGEEEKGTVLLYIRCLEVLPARAVRGNSQHEKDLGA